jgi:hypothetical protein
VLHHHAAAGIRTALLDSLRARLNVQLDVSSLSGLPCLIPIGEIMVYVGD